MTDNYITRKEFDEWVIAYEQRHGELQLQLSETLGITKNNGEQIRTLVEEVKELRGVTTDQGKQIAKAATYNKVLWPIVSVAISITSILATLLAVGHI